MKRSLWIVLLLLAACTPKIPPPGEREVEPPPLSPAAALVNEGMDLAQQHRYPEAVLRLREAIETDPHFAEAFARLGILYRRLDKLDQAREALSRALELAPENSKFLYAMGTVFFDLGEYDRAERVFRKSWSLDGRLNSLFSLGETLQRLGRDKQAAEAWREYLRRDADSVWGREAAKRLEDLGAGDHGRER